MRRSNKRTRTGSFLKVYSNRRTYPNKTQLDHLLTEIDLIDQSIKTNTIEIVNLNQALHETRARTKQFQKKMKKRKHYEDKSIQKNIHDINSITKHQLFERITKISEVV